ncbi:nitroreductase [Ferrovibrio sp.]|uniref:nitroreductase n=1 Tax=Ferrovibrio sp. TaxID=1917215 RepID=UPI003D26DF06
MAKKIIDYLQQRSSIRAFKPDPVPAEVLQRLLAAGSEAPSWSNTQPYRVAVAQGDLRDRIAKALCDRFDGAVEHGRPREYHVPDKYPAELQPRRVACGFGLYGALGIERQDMAARAQQMRRNFHFFDAPVGLFIYAHGALDAYAALDAGAYMQSVMLAALDEGLGTCAQAALATWPDAVTPFFDVPPEYKLLCGLAVGYPAEHVVNTFRPHHLPPADLSIAAK